jgi:STAS-like domain of unknown function (DUF4325)
MDARVAPRQGLGGRRPLIEIHLATDFSPFLGGRRRVDGPWSGEQFREDLLAPRFDEARARGARLVVVLDGVAAVPSAFLEEAFGGLLRVRADLALTAVESTLEITANTPELLPFARLARTYTRSEDRRRSTRARSRSADTPAGAGSGSSRA